MEVGGDVALAGTELLKAVSADALGSGDPLWCAVCQAIPRHFRGLQAIIRHEFVDHAMAALL